MEIKGNHTGGTEMDVKFATKGNARTIHIVVIDEKYGFVSTMCNGWSCDNNLKARVRPIAAEAATCKSCLKISASKEVQA
jgi:hypothetical protein